MIKTKQKDAALAVTPKLILPLVEEIRALEIVDKSTMEIAVEDLSRANKFLDSVIEYKEKKTKPLNQALKVIRDETRPLENDLKELIDGLRIKMTIYQTRIEEERIAEENRIASRIGTGKGKLKIETAVQKISDLEEVDKQVEATSGKVTFKAVRKFEVVDIALLPIEYHMPNELEIKSAMKDGIELPGVRYYTEQVPTNFR